LMAGAMAANSAVAAPAQSILHNFCQAVNCADGAFSRAGLVSDGSGHLYGTTSVGGAHDNGSVFELTQSGGAWTESVIYSFCPARGCSDGAYPAATLILDGKGNLFGTTIYGGKTGDPRCATVGCGTVFELSPANDGWTYQTLYTFGGGTDGANPTASVILDKSGNLYGTTFYGGAGPCDQDGQLIGCGTVYEVTPSNGGWAEYVVYNFCSVTHCTDGSYPVAGLIFDTNGNLYGTTYRGGDGSQPSGTVFKLALSNGGWTEGVLYNFCSVQGCADGAYPYAGLVFDNNGNLYGTTSSGGNTTHPAGTVFELTPSNADWTENVLLAFNFNDGLSPEASLIFDSKGDLYGTTSNGGSSQWGVVFQLAPSAAGWTEKVFSFNITDGASPAGGVILEGGSLYGSTYSGGANGAGVAYKLTP